jgi:hypothetical protein
MFSLAFVLDPQVQVKPDGTRYLRYQLPKQPIEPGSLFIGGYLRSTVDGLLFNPANRQVGVVDFDTGVFDIDIEYNGSPGISTRTVEFVYPRRSPR